MAASDFKTGREKSDLRSEEDSEGITSRLDADQFFVNRGRCFLTLSLPAVVRSERISSTDVSVFSRDRERRANG